MKTPTAESLIEHAPLIARAIEAYRQLDDEGQSAVVEACSLLELTGRARQYNAEVLIAALFPEG